MRTYDVCNRLAQVFVYRGCQKAVHDIFQLRPVHHHRHTRDLSALIDVAGRDYVEVVTCRKYSVKVGHHAVLPEEAVGPAAGGVKGASHRLAPVVDAGGKGGSISRRKVAAAEAGDCIVLPKDGHGCAVRVNGLPNNLAAAVNGVGYGERISEVWKRDGSEVFPQYGVMHGDAGSGVAYGLALIVDAKRDPVCIFTVGRKSLSLDLALDFLPQHRQVNPIRNRARGAGGVHDTIFRIACDLSAVIDGAGLPVIPAQRWQSAHDAVFPEKRKTRKVCAEIANIFPIRIRNRCLGHTDAFPAVVDSAPIDRTVLSSQRAEFEVEFSDGDRIRASRGRVRGGKAERMQELLHVQRPAVIIEAHGHAQVVTVLNAQILNFVARLRDRIAEASQNHRRNPEYPEIPQPPKRDHMSSIPPVNLWCRDDWRFTSGTTRRSDSQRAIESRSGSQLHELLLSQNRGSMWCSTFKTIT